MLRQRFFLMSGSRRSEIVEYVSSENLDREMDEAQKADEIEWYALVLDASPRGCSRSVYSHW